QLGQARVPVLEQLGVERVGRRAVDPDERDLAALLDRHVARHEPGLSATRLGEDVLMILPYILFFLAGLAFGYAIESQLAWIVLAIPLLFALGAALSQGADG